jgi:hypothetical protein
MSTFPALSTFPPTAGPPSDREALIEAICHLIDAYHGNLDRAAITAFLKTLPHNVFKAACNRHEVEELNACDDWDDYNDED